MKFEEAWAYSSTIKGWYTEAEARLLWDCAQEMRERGPFLEIGSYRGRTASLLAQANPTTLHLCEPFILAPGSPNDTPESEGRYVSDEFHEEIFADFGRNMARFDYTLWKRKSDIFESDEDSEINGIPDTFSLIHVDGDHADGVFTDARIAEWLLPLRGIAVFHDYELIHTKFTRVKEAVDALGWEVFGKADSAIAVLAHT